MHAWCIGNYNNMKVHRLYMHSASKGKKTKSKDVAVRLDRNTWATIGEFTKKTHLKKKAQVDVLVENEKNRLRKIEGVKQ